MNMDVLDKAIEETMAYILNELDAMGASDELLQRTVMDGATYFGALKLTLSEMNSEQATVNSEQVTMGVA